MRALAVTLVAGCASLAPTYERPAAPIPATLTGGIGTASAADVPLAQFVRDPNLREILARVVTHNRTLRRAVLDVEAARQGYRIQRSANLPAIEASASVTARRNVFDAGSGSVAITSTTYAATVGLASWEIDLFGKLKSQADAKLQSYYATIETAKAVRISLLAEAAISYITLAADESRLVIARETMATSQRAMDLTNQLVGGGTSNRSDYWQATTVYQQARADVAALTVAIQQDRNALELLAGPLEDRLIPTALPTQLDWFADIPVGVSSSVLMARPDVLAAEHALQAANANIGVARAQFFPSLTLTADGGVASGALGALFSGPSVVWTLAPRLALPLFRGGVNRANLALSKTQKESLVAAYQLAIQSAFREVADALATRASIQEQLAAQAALVEAATKSFELAQARYAAGIEPFLSTLISQRALYASQNSLIATQLTALANRVTLYRVFGGGLQ